MNLLN